VIVQSNPFNDSQIATVVVATITSNLALAQARGNVRVSRNHSGLQKASVVNVSQIYTLDKLRVTELVKVLPSQVMQRVDEGIRLVLGL
jgi:mRNA interferase MazF